MKTFKDLEFKPHPCAIDLQETMKGETPDDFTKEMMEAKQAVMDFPNGYGVSVVFGPQFYSNGIDTYEVGIMYNDRLALCEDVKGWLTQEEVTEVMIEVQKRK